jgi:cytoskeletal protein RodZ
MKLNSKLVPAMAVLLLFVMLGGPQMMMAQSTAQPSQSAQPSQTTTDTSTPEPAASSQLPNAPSAQAVGAPALPQDAQQPADQNSNAQQKQENPVGAAAAQKGVTAGGAASKPAGTAIAPAKQRQVRSFLLKLGLIAAGGAAIGTVYALSKGTASTPPGSGR